MKYTEFATEATPLTPETAHTSTSRRRCIPLSIMTAAYLLLVLALLTFQSYTSRNIHSSTIRHDVVENAVPQKMFLAQPSPTFYLPALNRKELMGTTNGSGRGSAGKEGLRWGILGLGRIAHDFTSA